MAKPAVNSAVEAYFAEKATHNAAKLTKALTAEHTRRIKNVFTAHIADAALKSDGLRINELKALQRSLITAIQGAE